MQRYTHNKENKIHGNISFPYVIYYSVMPEHFTSYPAHWHSEMELIYVVSGKMNVSINGITYHLKDRMILLIMPEILHSFEQAEKETVIYYNIVFDFSILISNNPSNYYTNQYLLPYITSNVDFIPILSPDMYLYTEINCCIQTLLKPQFLPAQELLIISQLYLLFHYLEAFRNDPINSKPIYSNAQIGKIKQIITYIEEHYRESLKLSEIAALFGFSTSYFMRFFKTYTGTTYIQYVNNYRLEIAAYLLLYTKENILSISETVGFDNHSYFIRSFKKKYNCTPHKYRKKCTLSK